MRRSAYSRGTLLPSIFVLVLFVGVGLVIMPNFIGCRSPGQLTACKSNLKNLGTGLEMYSSDFAGRYPRSLHLLTPNYLKTLPHCPAAGLNTYRLTLGPKAPGNTRGFSDYYLLECTGSSHEKVGVAAFYPKYDGIKGLIEGP